MKKITALFMLLLSAALLVIPTTFAADDELVDLYPYDDPGALYGPSTIYTLVGDSNWDAIYGGVRYHVVRGGVRYAKDFEDKNADGYISALEIGALSWNAFASVIINDTEEQMVLSTTNARTDLTSVVHRIYAYFDADGKLSMVEDHINTYDIINDGTAEEPDWRLATAEEVDDAEIETRNIHVRMIADESDEDGYVLEPIGYLTWLNPDLADLPEAERSLFLDENPNYVTIPAGWTVWSFGTNDRGTQNAKTTAFIKTLPAKMAANYEGRLEMVYDTQAPVFAGVSAMDDDLVTPGINKVVEFNGSFALPAGLSVSYTKMYDEDGKIINKVTKLPFTVDIIKGEEVLETITYDYDAETDAYTASGVVTKVDSSVFGAGYIAQFKAQIPGGKETIVNVDVVIGVMPPKFKNVANRFHREDTIIDLLGAITADDGYGNDKTADIQISYPQNFNPYYPQPGVYTIDLEFTHHVHIPGTPSYPARVNLAGTQVNLTHVDQTPTTYVGNTTIYTKPFQYNWTGYAAFLVAQFDKDGNFIQSVNRTDWNAKGLITGKDALASDALIKAWLEGLTFEDGGYVVFFGVAGNLTASRALDTGSVVTYSEAVVGIPDFDTDIVTRTSYKLTVTDHTAPTLLVVDNKYTIEAGKLTNVNDAILANVVAFDNYDTDLAIYVASNGGLNLNKAGQYTVTVEAEDGNGNVSQATFKVTVVEPKGVSQDDLNAAIEDLQAEIDNLKGQLLSEERVLELINARLDQFEVPSSDSGKVGVGATVGISVGSALASFGGAFLLFRRR